MVRQQHKRTCKRAQEEVYRAPKDEPARSSGWMRAVGGKGLGGQEHPRGGPMVDRKAWMDDQDSLRSSQGTIQIAAAAKKQPEREVKCGRVWVGWGRHLLPLVQNIDAWEGPDGGRGGRRV